MIKREHMVYYDRSVKGSEKQNSSVYSSVCSSVQNSIVVLLVKSQSSCVYIHSESTCEHQVCGKLLGSK